MAQSNDITLTVGPEEQMQDKLARLLKTPFDTLDEVSDTNTYDDEVIALAREVLDAWDGWQYGRTNHTVAATVVWIASRYSGTRDDRLNQEDVAETFGSSPVSMRQTWHSIYEDVGAEDLALLFECDPADIRRDMRG